MTEATYSPGLEGVIAGETAVCSVEQDGLFYRGYDVTDLATHGSFEECAYLVLHGELPTAAQLKKFTSELESYRPLSDALVDMLRLIPAGTPMMDIVRTGVSACAHFDPVTGDDEAAWRKRAMYMAAQITGMIAARLRLQDGKEPVAPKPGLSHAAQFLYQVTGTAPEAEATRVLDLTLILYMEHEYNASTFVARVCASTLTDLFSCVVAGIGTLKGPLHGGANEAAMEMLRQFDSAEEARAWTLESFDLKRKIMGFGHRVYKNGDHRARILEAEMRNLAKARNQEKWLPIYDAVKTTMDTEKGIYPNVDYPCGLTYFMLDMPVDIYTPLFVASRVIGWSAHAIEQHFNNRIIRPRSRYTGPENRAYEPMGQRG